jgi:hypothetical protein
MEDMVEEFIHINMALKDWKKISTNKYSTLYSTKDHKKVLTIRYTWLRVVNNKYKDKIWIVYFGNAKRKDFKTKQQALKFAKSYMRKH